MSGVATVCMTIITIRWSLCPCYQHIACVASSLYTDVSLLLVAYIVYNNHNFTLLSLSLLPVVYSSYNHYNLTLLCPCNQWRTACTIRRWATVRVCPRSRRYCSCTWTKRMPFGRCLPSWRMLSTPCTVRRCFSCLFCYIFCNSLTLRLIPSLLLILLVILAIRSCLQL